jgi:hypothetical protein
VNGSLVDEVAAVNDSIPPSATPQERWKTVTGWLRWKLNFAAKGPAKPKKEAKGA